MDILRKTYICPEHHIKRKKSNIQIKTEKTTTGFGKGVKYPNLIEIPFFFSFLFA